MIAKLIVRELIFVNKEHFNLDNKCQKYRCEQTLTFIDQLIINNFDLIWIFSYRQMLYYCFQKQKFYFDFETESNFEEIRNFGSK